MCLSQREGEEYLFEFEKTSNINYIARFETKKKLLQSIVQ